MKVPVYKCCLQQAGEIEMKMKQMGSTLDLGIVAESLGYTEFPEEHTGMFCLNEGMEIIGYHEFAIGTPSNCEYRAGDAIKRALLNNATSIVMVHNHPTETVAKPSDQDIKQYKEFEVLCSELGIRVLDSVVIAGDGKRNHKFGEPFAKSILVEMAERGLLDEDRAKIIEMSKMPDTM